jgi:hypothetical protein
MDHPTTAFPQPLPNTNLSSTAAQSGLFARDYSGLIRILRHATHPQNHSRIRAMFEDVEVLLGSRDRECRTQAIEFLEALQDSWAWSDGEPDAFQSLMGPGAQRIWSTLTAIRSDLAECSVFEAEVGIWRVVHQRLAS